MIRIVLIALLVGFILLVRLAPWWSVPVILVVLLLLGKLFLRVIVDRLFKGPFRAKGAVLKGAKVGVHSVEPAEAPAPQPEGTEGNDAEAQPCNDEREVRNYYRIELTITPEPPRGGFRLWEPGELVLTGPDARPEELEDAPPGEVASIELFQEGAFVRDEGFKCEGPQRLRLLVGVLPEYKVLKFRYYFELFGEVRLPEGPGSSRCHPDEGDHFPTAGIPGR